MTADTRDEIEQFIKDYPALSRGYRAGMWKHYPTYSTSWAIMDLAAKACARFGLWAEINWGFDDNGAWASLDHKGVTDTHPLYRGRWATIQEALGKALLKAIYVERT